MKRIGIIANPNSGKDLRRLFSYALTIDTSEKINLMERVVLGAQDLGIEEFFIMPDIDNMGESVRSTLKRNNDLKANINILDFEIDNSERDTLKASRMLNEMKVDCIVVIGGDGTSRLVAKSKPNCPIIPVSTGTNNVYPSFYEGTIVGMAAAVISAFGPQEDYIIRDKIIEVYKNGEIIDCALIDAAITLSKREGSIEEIKDIDELVVSRSHPASLGLSSIIGAQEISLPEDDFGFFAKFHRGYTKLKAPFTPGKMVEAVIDGPSKLVLNQMYVAKPTKKGTLALDGEKIIKFSAGDLLGFVIRRKGPLRVKVEEALKYGVDVGFFSG